jgi:hypothetical protein
VIRKLAMVGALAILGAAPGCTCNPEPGSGSKPLSGGPAGGATSSAKPVQTAQSKAGPGEILWDVPSKWKEAPNPNAMRIATYFVGRADGDSDDAEMSVSRVGGSVEANLGRWKAQFDPPKPDSTKRFERTVAGLKVTIFETAGSYTGMVIKGQAPKPHENWALLAAIVEVPGGDPWFFKLTGPEKTLAAARPDFESLANSVRPK